MREVCTREMSTNYNIFTRKYEKGKDHLLNTSTDGKNIQSA